MTPSLEPLTHNQGRQFRVLKIYYCYVVDTIPARMRLAVLKHGLRVFVREGQTAKLAARCGKIGPTSKLVAC
jgi:hypothetical protein